MVEAGWPCGTIETVPSLAMLRLWFGGIDTGAPSGPSTGRPLAVVSIRERAAADIDAQGTVDDIMTWESAHGPLPDGAFVALDAGWDARVNDPASYLNVDGEGVPHFPGWHPDATAFLLAERSITGLGVDTVSLDFGASTDFGTHVALLGAGKYGLENLAALGLSPDLSVAVKNDASALDAQVQAARNIRESGAALGLAEGGSGQALRAMLESPERARREAAGECCRSAKA